MVAMNSVNLLLVFLLIRAGNSSSHQIQSPSKIAGDGSVELEVAGNGLMKMSKGIEFVPSKAHVKRTTFGGRKVKLERVLLKKEGAEGEAFIGEKTTFSGAVHFVGNSGHNRMRALNVKHKSSRRSNTLGDKLVGITAFTADYHQPESHPPKNN